MNGIISRNEWVWARVYSALTMVRSLTYTRRMQVYLTAAQEAELSELATRKGRDTETLAREVLDFYLKHEARFIEAVKRGILSADRGDLIEHDELLARITRLVGS